MDRPALSESLAGKRPGEIVERPALSGSLSGRRPGEIVDRPALSGSLAGKRPGEGTRREGQGFSKKNGFRRLERARRYQYPLSAAALVKKRLLGTPPAL